VTTERCPPMSDPSPEYVLRLFVAGTTTRSVRAIANLRRICEQHLSGRYNLEVIDVYQNPELAKEVQVFAAPTLIKELPLPLRQFVGDLSDTDKVVLGLAIQPKEPPTGAGESEN
jgi:circadian clock protein KaiB